MKRILPILLMLLAMTGMVFAEDIYYETTPTLAWDAVTTMGDGRAFLPGDVLSYEVYISDRAANPSIETRQLSELTLIGTSAIPQMQLAFPYRTQWQVGVRAKHVDGGGNVTFSPLAYISVAANVAGGVPFVYLPVIVWLAAPTGLRDSATPAPGQ